MSGPRTGYFERRLETLPIDLVMSDLIAGLSEANSVVLVAPPGAGKTTRVPLALLDCDWVNDGKIVMLEPRRLAARAAAQHMARQIGENVGETVGYRVRMDSVSTARTKIEVVTEGIFTRMILSDPELNGVSAVLFDEFHERNLDGDLGLALALDVQQALRPELRIIPMSATLDGAKVTHLLENARIIESKGRLYPVDIEYRPSPPRTPIEQKMASAIRRTVSAQREDGTSVLCFLPGQGEIHRTAELLHDLPADIEIRMLYGALDGREQDAAIAPAPAGRRKIVLATPVAETSITIEGISTVIDSGLVRVPRYEADVGTTRLETVRASKSAIDQRAGRAGRTGPGMAIRLWNEGQTRALPDHASPEILNADLSSLVLDLADWGTNDPGDLTWLDSPPEAAWRFAVELLQQLGAVAKDGRITAKGRAIRQLNLPPRLATMVHHAAGAGQERQAALLATVMSETGLGGSDPDLETRLTKATNGASERFRKARKLAERIAKTAESIVNSAKTDRLSIGGLVSLAWPERIAKQVRVEGSEQGSFAVFALANGRQARLHGPAHLQRSELLAVAEMTGQASRAVIRSAAPLEYGDIKTLHDDKFEQERIVFVDASSKKVKATERELLGALRLKESPSPLGTDDDIATAITTFLREHGLSVLPSVDRAFHLIDRLRFAHSCMPDHYPDASEEALMRSLDQWLVPFLAGVDHLAQINDAVFSEAIGFFAGPDTIRRLEKDFPPTYAAPEGSRFKIRYNDGKAVVSLRVQQVYGLTDHPKIGGGRVPLTLELLSPAMRPIQLTEDIAGFWKGSWDDVRKEMRGRYPKHLWPEAPAKTAATRKTKSSLNNGKGG